MKNCCRGETLDVLWTHKLQAGPLPSCIVSVVFTNCIRLKSCWFTVISPSPLSLFPPLPPALSASLLSDCTDSIFLLCRPAFASVAWFVICFVLQEEVVAGHREGAHQNDELGEVNLPVVVGVQVVHHLLNCFIIFGALAAGNRERQIELSMCMQAYGTSLHRLVAACMSEHESAYCHVCVSHICKLP